MGATIHTIPLGIDNVYVVKDKGAVIIDSGAPKKGKAFKKALENVGIKPEEIQLINIDAAKRIAIIAILRIFDIRSLRLFISALHLDKIVMLRLLRLLFLRYFPSISSGIS